MFLTFEERMGLQRDVWLTKAVAYMIEIRFIDGSPSERCLAWELAENLYVTDEYGNVEYTPEEAVDEELTYWSE